MFIVVLVSLPPESYDFNFVHFNVFRTRAAAETFARTELVAMCENERDRFSEDVIRATVEEIRAVKHFYQCRWAWKAFCETTGRAYEDVQVVEKQYWDDERNEGSSAESSSVEYSTTTTTTSR
jgi:hypothetical protein